MLASCKNYSRFEVAVLLQRGSQAGDPAILREIKLATCFVGICAHKSLPPANSPPAHCIASSGSHAGTAPTDGCLVVQWSQTYVALEGTLENQLLSHCRVCFKSAASREPEMGGIGYRWWKIFVFDVGC